MYAHIKASLSLAKIQLSWLVVTRVSLGFDGLQLHFIYLFSDDINNTIVAQCKCINPSRGTPRCKGSHTYTHSIDILSWFTPLFIFLVIKGMLSNLKLLVTLYKQHEDHIWEADTWTLTTWRLCECICLMLKVDGGGGLGLAWSNYLQPPIVPILICTLTAWDRALQLRNSSIPWL